MFLVKYFILLLFIQFSLSNNFQLINLIKDFVLIQRIPTKICFNLCWPKSTKTAFAKQLNTHSISFQSVSENICNYQLPTVQLFLLDLRCPGYTRSLIEGNDRNLFKHPHRWLVIINDIKDIPPNFNILVDSQFCLIKRIDSDVYSLFSIYKISKYSKEFLINDIATWSFNIGFQYFNYLNNVRNRSNLVGTEINISMVITDLDSMKHLWDYRDRHIDSMTKLNYVLCHHISNFMNTSNHFIVRNTWGYKNTSNNKFDGMIGDLQSELAEMSGSPTVLTIDRLSVLDYIGQTTPTSVRFIFRAPLLSQVTNVLTLPFEETVWYAWFLLLAVTSVVIYVIILNEWTKRALHATLGEQQKVMMSSFTDVLLMQLGVICQQGCESEPKSNAGRIATISLFTSLMFIYIFYSANIVVLLQSTSENIKTVEDLLNSRIKLGAEDVLYNKYYMQTESEPIRKAIYTQKLAPKLQPSNFMNMETGIRKMRDEFFAFHVETGPGYKKVGEIFEETEKCRLREIKYSSYFTNPWMAVRKNSSIKELAKIAYRKLHESGLQNREFKRIYYDKKPVCQCKSSSVTQVGLMDCHFAYLIFEVGCFISLCILLLEIYMKRKYVFKKFTC